MRGGMIVQAIDTKWKRLTRRMDDPKQDVSQSDVYQMMAHARIYDCRRLMLLYPHHAGLEAAVYYIPQRPDQLDVNSRHGQHHRPAGPAARTLCRVLTCGREASADNR